jgi:endo-1,4-beta-xylanase
VSPERARVSADAGPESLDALARAKGLRFGTAIGTQHLGDPRYLEITRAECGLLVSENEHKWYTLHDRPDGFDFERADALTAWGEGNGLAYRGHTLLWHHPRWIPRWVSEHDFGPQPRAAAEAMLADHISTVCGRYPQIASWDVVNETVDENTGALRETVWTRAIGPEVIDVAFHAARAARPDAQLVYNDYMAWEHWSAAHRDGVLRHLEAWLARGLPIDALGVQSHLGTNNNFDDATDFWASQEREWRAFLDEVTGMGLDLLITELDVHDRGLPAGIAERDKICAEYAKAYLDIMLSYPETQAIVVWGMEDGSSWLQGRAPRDDGLPKRPAPYDAEYRPKPLREAIAAALRSAPERPTRA